ncbi:MAG: helix-turn-helix transcriptional regulator [Litorimonas sp.]
MTVTSGCYHHIPAIGEDDLKDLNRYYNYKLPQAIADYFDRTEVKDRPGAKFIFASARHLWLSDIIEVGEFDSEFTDLEMESFVEDIGDGIVTPLFGPYNKRGFIYTSFKYPKSFYDDAFGWQIQALHQVVHNRYCLFTEALRNRADLTERESEVLELITFGKTNPEIATILGISSSTVTGYVERIFIKMGTKDRVSTAVKALKFRLI